MVRMGTLTGFKSHMQQYDALCSLTPLHYLLCLETMDQPKDQQQLVWAVFNGHNVMADWQRSLFPGLQSEDQEERICAFASSLKGAEPVSTNELRGEVQENGTIRCSRGSRCYGLWERLADGEMQLLNQGQERSGTLFHSEFEPKGLVQTVFWLT